MSEASNRTVLIVGVGGLGVPAVLALASAGIGDCELRLIDPDPVELSNLPRQVLYYESDCGLPKVTAAASRIAEIASGLRVATHVAALRADNVFELIAASDFVIDATDDPATKFLINDACLATQVPFVYGGVIGMTGQAMTVVPGRTACLRCLFEEPPDADEAASCRDAGIVGPVAGAIGEVQAAEAARWLRGATPTLAGSILTYDGKAGRVRVTPIAARPSCSCGAAGNTLAAVRTS